MADHNYVINILPNDNVAGYRKALGYLWQDLDNQVPGIDIIGGYEQIAVAKKQVEASVGQPIEWHYQDKLPSYIWLAGDCERVAIIKPMWCGGGTIYGHIISDKANDIRQEQARKADVRAAEERAREIANLRSIIKDQAEAAKRRFGGLMPTEAQARDWQRRYNDAVNEGGFGYVPYCASQESVAYAQMRLANLLQEDED